MHTAGVVVHQNDVQWGGNPGYLSSTTHFNSTQPLLTHCHALRHIHEDLQ